MIVNNPIGLIGDVLGTFPVLQQMNKDYEEFSVICHPEAKWLYDLVPEIKLCECSHFDKEINLSGAFTVSHQINCFMSQAHYPFMGYPIPEHPIKADLKVKRRKVDVYDFIFAPFGRSAPNEQKWERSKWIELISMLSGKYKIAIVGSSKHDEKFNLSDIATCYDEFDLDAQTLCNLLLKARFGCISIVTGISHLCFHLGVKNYLITNQTGMTWGENPSAIFIRDYIPNLSPETVLNVIHSS